MSRKYHTLRLGDDQYRLRLTIRGQNNLRERFQEDTIQTVLGAATDSRRMVALLEEALNWEGYENAVTDGERFYDLLVDQGYCGQIQFSGLAFDIAACSGLVTAEQAKTLKESVAKAVTDAYAEADQERQRRLLQNQALIAWGQAAVLCRHLAGEKQLPIYEVFPFWTTDEVNEMRLNEYRRRMERMAAKGGNGGG